MISEQIKSARALLADIRRQQRELIDRGWDDEGRTLTDTEAKAFDLLGKDATAFEAEIRALEQRLEAEAATAKPPRSNFD